MATDKVAGNLFTAYVNTGTEGSPTWTKIGGLNEKTLDTSESTVDAADDDSPGWDQSRQTSRGKSITLKGFYKVDTATGTRDPGQLAVERSGDTVAGETYNIQQYKIAKSWGGQITFKATAVVKSGLGGSKDLSPWEATLTMTEKPVEA